MNAIVRFRAHAKVRAGGADTGGTSRKNIEGKHP